SRSYTLALHDALPISLDGGRAAVIRDGGRYSVVWPDGTNMHVDVRGLSVNVFVLAAESRDGRLVGLFGNGDGDGGANDFRTRERSEEHTSELQSRENL